MGKIFQRWKRVRKVFITRKLVKFLNVRNAEKLEKDLDTIIIGNVKLHVNKPLYRRTKYIYIYI